MCFQIHTKNPDDEARIYFGKFIKALHRVVFFWVIIPNIFIGFFILSNFFVFAAVLSLYFASYIYKYLSLIMNQGLPKRYFDQFGLISMLQTLQRFGPVLT
jgi:hypothetical protein